MIYRLCILGPNTIGLEKNVLYPLGESFRTLESLGVASCDLCHFLGVASSGLCHFQEWPVWDSVFFLPFRHIEKLGGRKNSGTPSTLALFKKDANVEIKNALVFY